MEAGLVNKGMMDTTKHIKPCAGYEESLILSRYGELGSEEEKALGAHLSGCPACRAYRDGLASALVELPDAKPGQFETRKAARGVMARIRTPHERPAYSRYLAPAFATLALIVTAVWIGLYQAPVSTNAPEPVPAAAPANVIANTTGHRGDMRVASAQSDFEAAQNLELLADLDLMEDIDTLDRIEKL